MTLSDLLREQDTLEQLRILALADRWYQERAGRYYFGQLSPEAIKQFAKPEHTSRT